MFRDPYFIAIKANLKIVDQNQVQKFLQKHEKNFILYANQIHEEKEFFMDILENNRIDYEVLNTLHPAFASHYKPFDTPKDGNCLWHMVSISISGSIKLTSLLRDMTFVTLIVLKNRFI